MHDVDGDNVGEALFGSYSCWLGAIFRLSVDLGFTSNLFGTVVSVIYRVYGQS